MLARVLGQADSRLEYPAMVRISDEYKLCAAALVLFGGGWLLLGPSLWGLLAVVLALVAVAWLIYR